jgi:polysaccharide pyruvyl transferase WcaK-like protein
MTTYLYGAYGTGNLGDDALLKSALECYGTEDTYAVCYRKPFLRDSVRWIAHSEFTDNPTAFIKKGDRLILAGGGLFWSAAHADVMADLAVKAKKIGCAFLADRIGVQGVHFNPDAARTIFELCDEITVRDHESVKVLKDMNITDRAVARSDLVLYLKDLPTSRRDAKSVTRIGINHSVNPFFYDESHRRKTLQIYSKLADAFPHVKFVYIPHTRHFNVISENDIITGEYFWKFSNERIESLPFPKDVEGWLREFSKLSGVIGWRFHLMVVATVLGKPAAYLGQLGGHKYGAFASENGLPQINFDAPLEAIIESATRYVEMVENGTAVIAKLPLDRPPSTASPFLRFVSPVVDRINTLKKVLRRQSVIGQVAPPGHR